MRNFFLIIIFFSGLSACGNKDQTNTNESNREGQQGTSENDSNPPSFNYPEKEATDLINQWIDSTKVSLNLPQINENYFNRSLFQFYQNRNFQPAWNTATAEELISVLSSVENEGLNASSYPVNELEDLYNQIKNGSDAKAGARLDVLLSASYLKLADVIATGKVKAGKYNDNWHIRPEKPDELYLQLEKAVTGKVDQSLDFFRPQFPQYNLLLKEIGRYASMIQNGGWPTVAGGEALTPGDTSKRMQTIRRRLYISGDYKVPPENWQQPTIYDSAFIPVIEGFQRRHGLEAEPVIGENTIGALNVSAAMRQKQVMLNLDRIRWFASGDMPGTYVMVNIPDYRLTVVENGEPIKRMKVVVGEVMNTTPVFSDYIEYSIFSPYWNVPTSITEEEIWPTARKNPQWLINNHYEVLSGWSEDAEVIPVSEINWDNLDTYRVRQTPGPWNALGRVKYMFPNEYAIYLHDTPADQLFDKQHRAYSHGCIRIEDPVWFGDWLYPQYSAQDIQRKMQNKKRDIVPVDEHVPVFILYLTAFVDKDGILNFRRDLYELDKKLAQEFNEI